MVDIEQLKRTIIGFWQSEGTLRMLQHIFVVIIFFRIIFSYRFQKRGKIGVVDLLVKRFLRLFGKLSFVRKKMQKELEAKASQTVLGMVSKKSIKPTYSHIPNEGLKHQFLLNEIDVRKQADIDPTVGKTFAYVYEYSKKHSKFTAECFQKYIHSNALNPLVFNSLRVFEVQTIRMVANLFNGDQKCVGSVTSCGTESLILAMKIYRDYRGKGQVLMCTTGHPGINKGCDYVGLDVVQIPYDKNFKMDLKQLRKKISTNTVVVVCSAAQYPHGVVDNIEQVAKICLKYGVPLHVDAAIGGFVLPFIEMLGQHKFRPWDFRVKGVTSINADVHKYGYCPKGASVLICANSEIRRKQFYTFATWPGGIYFSPTILGSRNGGAIVAAWGALLGLGLQGYKQSTRRILKICQKIKEAIRLNPDLELVVEPQMTIITFTSKTINVFELADCLDTKGFHAQKQQNCLHLSIMPQHQPIVDDLIIKLNQAVKQVKESPKKYESGSRAVYGSLAKIPDQVIVQQFVSYFTDEIYKFH